MACGSSTDPPVVPPDTHARVETSGQLTNLVMTSTLSLKEQIAQLEKSGQVPLIDQLHSVLDQDVNNNWVRHDLDAYINSLSLTPAKSKSAFQDARAMQKTLSVDVTDKAALQQVGELAIAGANCFSGIFTDSQESMRIRRTDLK